ncbi:MAG: glycosyltransferase [Phenylobacterium sp.]
MKLAVFGLTVSSSWGNGHATLWRGLIRALGRRGCEVVFFERDVAYYAAHRDLTEIPGARVVLYPDWATVAAEAAREVSEADAALVTSYCPDGPAACDLVCGEAALSVFYDMDTPVTLARLSAGEGVDYLPADGLGGFDLVLSYTGGRALTELETRLGARRARPLYGQVDPDRHRPAAADPRFEAGLSYLGTYAADRQPALRNLFVEPARLRPDLKFLIGGSGYPEDFPWSPNVWFARHVAPPEHPAFFCSSRLTLNITRRDMAAFGWCPSGRLFEAAACGAPVISDDWEGLGAFFTPGREILVARGTTDVLQALDRGDLAEIARAARERTLDEHTADHRAGELLALLDEAASPAPRPRAAPRLAAET